ncbi:MAG: sensor histidine kinase, partial [Chitinophagaceae bacterium]
KMISIKVTDNGIGMDNATAANLFVKGKKVSSFGTYNETGTGLGLLLCKEFVEKNNGRIWVESKEGYGSIFYFTIPLFIG